jgi:hypothetical protein
MLTPFPVQCKQSNNGGVPFARRLIPKESLFMRIFALKPSTLLSLSAMFALCIFACACQQAATNANTNTAAANANSSPSMNVNASPATADAGPTIETREPDKYRATLTLTAEATGGGSSPNIPKLTADVARDGDTRRISFKLPNGEPVIYLDRADKRYAILPNRKQYAELTQEALGFDVARLMTPGQMVQYLKQQRGYERVGEEQMDGRSVIKYRYAGTTQTGTAAGEVKAETFVYVDKETGLPLRSELSSEATGNVQGVKGIKMVAVMSDISTDVDPAQFELPPGLKQVDPQQVRQQVDAFVAIAKVFILNMVNQQQQQQGGNTNSNSSATPGASMSPSPAASSSTTPVAP